MMMLMKVIRDDGWSGYSFIVNVQCMKIIYTSENKMLKDIGKSYIHIHLYYHHNTLL